MNQAFSKIWIMVVVIIFITGGILAWQYFKAPKEEIAFLQNGEIWILYNDLKTKTKLTDSGDTVERFSFSPDGKKIFHLRGGEIWSINRDGTNEVVLTNSEGKINWFWISPDGEFIAYHQKDIEEVCSDFPPRPMDWVWIMKKDGTNKVKVESPYPERFFPEFSQWFPNSKNLLILAKHPCEGYAEFWPPKDYHSVGLDGKNPQKFTPLQDPPGVIFPEEWEIHDFVFLPDGLTVAYSGVREKGNELWLVNYDGLEKSKIFEGSEENFLRILQFLQNGEQIIIGEFEGEYGYIRKILNLNKQGKIVFEIFPERLRERNLIEAIFSLDEEYIAIAHKPFGYRITEKYHDRDEVWIYNTFTKEIKEFVPEIPEIPPEKEYLHVKELVFSKNNRLFHQVSCGIGIAGISETFPQLWVIDTNTWKYQKIDDNVSQIVRIP